MRSFIINELEPLAYLVYTASLLFQCRCNKQLRHGVLSCYYLVAAACLYAGLAITVDNNNWSYNLMFIINVCVFSWYFFFIIQSRIKRNIILFCLLLNAMVFIYFNIIEDRFLSHFNSNVYGVAFLSIVVYALFYLHQLLTNVNEENLLQNFDFWLTCGYLLYFLGSFVIVIYYQDAEPHLRGTMWGLQNAILLLCAAGTLVVQVKKFTKQNTVHG